jgi:hypothetical protein
MRQRGKTTEEGTGAKHGKQVRRESRSFFGCGNSSGGNGGLRRGGDSGSPGSGTATPINSVPPTPSPTPSSPAGGQATIPTTGIVPVTNAAPAAFRIDAASLPPPFATASANNGSTVVPRPDGAALSVPPDFTSTAGRKICPMSAHSRPRPMETSSRWKAAAETSSCCAMRTGRHSGNALDLRQRTEPTVWPGVLSAGTVAVVCVCGEYERCRPFSVYCRKPGG